MELPSEAETDAFFTEVGRALNNFSSIEQGLERLFCAITDVNPTIGFAAMASIISFEARLVMCENIPKVGPLKEPLASLWPKIFARMREQLKKRNELAHFALVTLTIGENKLGLRLVPYHSWGKTTLSRGAQPNLGLAEIKQRAADFHEIAGVLQWLTQKVMEQRGRAWLPSEFHMPDPPLIQRLRSALQDSQTGAEPEQPPKPSRASSAERRDAAVWRSELRIVRVRLVRILALRGYA